VVDPFKEPQEIVIDVPAGELSPFGEVVELIMPAYEKKMGLTLKKKQVAALAEGLLSMASTIQQGVAEIMALEDDKASKLWKPE
jgi:hypothetical protein